MTTALEIDEGLLEKNIGDGSITNMPLRSSQWERGDCLLLSRRGRVRRRAGRSERVATLEHHRSATMRSISPAMTRGGALSRRDKLALHQDSSRARCAVRNLDPQKNPDAADVVRGRRRRATGYFRIRTARS